MIGRRTMPTSNHPTYRLLDTLSRNGCRQQYLSNKMCGNLSTFYGVPRQTKSILCIDTLNKLQLSCGAKVLRVPPEKILHFTTTSVVSPHARFHRFRLACWKDLNNGRVFFLERYAFLETQNNMLTKELHGPWRAWCVPHLHTLLCGAFLQYQCSCYNRGVSNTHAMNTQSLHDAIAIVLVSRSLA